MGFFVRFWATTLLAFIAMGVAGCGASPRMLQQGRSYYEECRAAELNPAYSYNDRRLCWEAWLRHYTTGQPIELTSYAQERRIALAHGESVAPLPDESDPAHELGALTLSVGESGTENVENAGQDNGVEDPAQVAEQVLDPSPDPQDQGSEDLSAATFRQEAGAPPGRHFQVRRIPPPNDIPTRSPPKLSQSAACSEVCRPAWVQCAAPCEAYGEACYDACDLSMRHCLSACH